MSVQRGTTRKAVSIKEPVHARLKGHVDAGGSESCSRFVENLLIETYPAVFGPDAPPPPPLTAKEQARRQERQTRSREREDAKRGFPKTDPPPAETKETKPESPVVTEAVPVATTPVTAPPVLPEPDEDLHRAWPGNVTGETDLVITDGETPEHEKPKCEDKEPVKREPEERKRPPEHLQPKPDPDLKPAKKRDDEDEFPPSIVFF